MHKHKLYIPDSVDLVGCSLKTTRDTTLGKYRHECRVCNGVFFSDNPTFRRICQKTPDLKPAAEKLGVTMADIGHYAQACAAWTAAGLPMREQAEVDCIYAICLACEEYADGRCKQCGCCVSAGWFPLTNKIKMATEDCRLEKWPKNAYSTRTTVEYTPVVPSTETNVTVPPSAIVAKSQSGPVSESNDPPTATT